MLLRRERKTSTITKQKQLNAAKCVGETLSRSLPIRRSRPGARCLRWESLAAYKAADVSERKAGKKEDIISLKLRAEQMLSAETR